jgi:hypothetical protein
VPILDTLRVNGERRELAVPLHKTLLEVLREDLGLTGTKHGCELGECGTCTVLADGEPEDPRCGGAGGRPDERGALMGPLEAPRAPRGERLFVVGHPLPQVDAWPKVVGETKFADDLVLPRMVAAKILRSPHPHARIRRIDTSLAAGLPGVYAVVTGRDFPPVKFGIMPVSQDEEALCVDRVRFVGDPVAAVAAVDEETAEEALRLIDVEYEPLAALMSIDQALREGSPRIHEYGDGHNIHKLVSLEFGDVGEGFREADLVREDVFFFEGNTHLLWLRLLGLLGRGDVRVWQPEVTLTGAEAGKEGWDSHRMSLMSSTLKRRNPAEGEHHEHAVA